MTLTNVFLRLNIATKHSLLFHKDNLQLWQKQKKKKFSEAFFKKLIIYCILNMAGTVGFDFEYVKVK